MAVTQGFNNQVATEPLPARAAEVKNNGGFATFKNKDVLTSLKVVFGDVKTEIYPGDTVYIRGDRFNESWAAPVDIEGQKVIMVPLSIVLLVKREPVPPNVGPESPGATRYWE